MSQLFFLSIKRLYVAMILEGQKRWEFRKRVDFGANGEYPLKMDDILFLVSVTNEKGSPRYIECACRVSRVLRGEQIRRHFGDRRTETWKEAGCDDNSERDWEFFANNILGTFQSALKVDPRPIVPAMDLSVIRHKTRGTPWTGSGLTAAERLKYYYVGEEPVPNYFQRLAESLFD